MGVLTADKLLTEAEKQEVIAAIAEAEMQTSGEIRLHIENYCKADVLDRAAYVFKTLGMHKTAERNGVLYYLAVKDKKFAILGDVGINAKVPDNFWDGIKSSTLEYFANGKYTAGLVAGIALAGEQLKQYFPREENDVNELPNEISFGE